ncbi:MAG: DUF2993 domain-containing protein [Elainellaceae cyanobacterium]
MSSPQLTRHLLSSALTLWLRSQVEQVAHLQVEIVGGDRQIWSGHIPGVSLQASDVVYSGLALSDVRLSAGQIRVNLGQIVRGKPLRLLEVVPVELEVALLAVDLGRSLQSELGRQALADVFRLILAALPELLLLPQQSLESLQFCQPQVALRGDRVRICGIIRYSNPTASNGHSEIPVYLDTGLAVLDGHRLCLMQGVFTITESEASESGASQFELDKLVIDLGADVTIQTLTVAPEGITCRGQINVRPSAQSSG